VVDRSSLELSLEEPGTTVTILLEQLAGERIYADKRRHVMSPATTPNLLGVAKDHEVLERCAVLRGRDSLEPYVYAESLLVPSRLPQRVCERLENSDEPMGQVLDDEGVEFTRFGLPCDDPRAPSLIRDSAPPDEYLLARRYRIEVASVPVVVIAEWFLPALEGFFRPE
jgi:chorismate-pyruvate lyase